MQKVSFQELKGKEFIALFLQEVGEKVTDEELKDILKGSKYLNQLLESQKKKLGF
jgi:serine/threonine protein phosphatase PrpC